MRFSAALLCVLLLSACTPRVILPARTPHLALDGPPPDVVILSVSGHCSPPCAAPYANGDDLSSRGTIDRVADAIAAAGYQVQVSGYAAGAFDTLESEWVFPPQRGWVALQNDFQEMRRRWPELGRRPRIVMLGHSQGVAWLHHLARLNPEVPIALQIDLDSICAAWQADHARFFRQLTPQQAGSPSIATACDPIWIDGRPYRGKNIVWPNVERSLEIQSKRLYAPAPKVAGSLSIFCGP
ncbi:hypothetical protein ACFP81_05125 [Deinococcus lacus]|uniref:Alpha/beta hydrolase n=1 Tax=Deinococcus lacus TaxID=392561 RepID=A0ABW1YF04_9DEIO